VLEARLREIDLMAAQDALRAPARNPDPGVKAMNNKTLVLTRSLLALTLLALGVAGGYQLASRKQPAATAAASAGEAERKVLYWYDPMVPTQKFDKPGKSPFMDMHLVPRYADEAQDGFRRQRIAAGGAVAGPAHWPRSSSAASRAASWCVGTVLLNDRDISIVQARANGFVERVYARAPGDVIAAGAPLAELLLPEWVAAQREYLAVRRCKDETLTRRPGSGCGCWACRQPGDCPGGAQRRTAGP
jgi:Cu(I)/Ag(I) efflux system membrane fusion protein